MKWATADPRPAPDVLAGQRVVSLFPHAIGCEPLTEIPDLANDPLDSPTITR